MKEQNTVEILSCSRCDELEARVKELQRKLDSKEFGELAEYAQCKVDLIKSNKKVKELKKVLKDIARDLDVYTPSSEAFRLATIAKNAITEQESTQDVCIYTAVGDNYYDSQCGIEGELITDTHCRKCGKQIQEVCKWKKHKNSRWYGECGGSGYMLPTKCGKCSKPIKED